MKKSVLYDLETYPKVFTASFLDTVTDEYWQFAICDTRDDRKALYYFLRDEVKELIGFNNLNFDSQIIELFMSKPKDITVNEIHVYADELIQSEEKFPPVKEWELQIPNIDLFKILALDNKARSCGLKWCEFSMDFHNIEDLPDTDDVDLILAYNLNDCYATKELWKRSQEPILLRQELSNKYKLNLTNASDTRIGSELALKLYCDTTGQDRKVVKKMRTTRPEIRVKDIIFPYIKFKSEDFNRVLERYNNTVITNTKSEIKFSTKHKGFKFDYGSGGIHGALKNIMVKEDEYYKILTCDVSSLYPSIAIVNNLYPAHLGEEFCKVYNDDIVAVRLREKAKGKDGNKTIVDGFKLAANSIYGRSNSQFSWLYDPQYTMATTINGQLLLSMLCESLMEIEDSSLVCVNTDGLEIKIPRHREAEYFERCKQWEVITKLQLEYAVYTKIIMRDVNNYIAVYDNGKTKCKGAYEFENLPVYKNKSYSIIPIAFYNHFVKGIPIEDTINNHKNIFDFCAGVRAKTSAKKGKGTFVLKDVYKEIDSTKYSKEDKEKFLSERGYYEYYGLWRKHEWGEMGGATLDSLFVSVLNKEMDELGGVITTPLSKTVRYYVSKKGQYLFKQYANGDSSHVEAPTKRGKFKKDWRVTVLNKYEEIPIEKRGIDYSYYMFHAREWVNQIELQNQLALF